MPSKHEPPFDSNESLSAVMDGAGYELELHRLLTECASDPQLRQRWVRYHLASAVIQKQPAALSHSLSFADAVRSAIDNEEKNITSDTKDHALFHGGGKVFSKVAIAASVALLVIVGAQWQQRAASSSVQQMAEVTPAIQHADHRDIAPAQKSLAGVSSSLGVENIFAQSGDEQSMRFGHQNGFENAALKTESTRAPLIRAAERNISRK